MDDRDTSQAGHTRATRLLISEEISRIVANAGDGVVSAGREAMHLAARYPCCGMTADEIANKIVIEAASAGVAVEASRPTREPGDDPPSRG